MGASTVPLSMRASGEVCVLIIATMSSCAVVTMVVDAMVMLSLNNGSRCCHYEGMELVGPWLLCEIIRMVAM